MAIIVITGAGAGLGRALARRFAADGETVVLLGRTFAKLEALAAELAPRAAAIACDVASPDSVRTAFAAIAAIHPRIDVLINNAAVFQPFTLAEATDAQILNTIGINLTGTILCTRAALKLLGPGGHILNLSSESVAINFPHLSLYQASKAAVEHFTHSMHQELEPAGIRVTLVRAGQMMEPGKVWDADPAAQMRFAEAAMAAGLNLLERPISQYEAVTNVFRALIDLPADVHASSISLHARKSAP